MAIYARIQVVRQLIGDGSSDTYSIDFTPDLLAALTASKVAVAIYSISGHGTILSSSVASNVVTVTESTAPPAGTLFNVIVSLEV